uniref:Tryptophan synthase alpha chain n=1 Tax=Dicranema revolutum TaxID=239144 RepID=A0A4D6WSR8_9FLOR|nr:Tryptophan synthase alpha subunit [Dicranema revolutum]
MTIISNKLLKTHTKCSLVPFITAGYPNLNTTIDALYTLDSNGADIIELGIPYSDALADGPIIQESSRVALNQGIHIDQIINMLQFVIPNIKAPIIIFTYYNPILVKGIKSFILNIALAGVQGLIIPDLPLEETDYLIELCHHYGIELVLFVAPTSSQSRISSILAKSTGCIYLVSSCGITGIRDEIDAQVNILAKQIKSQTNKAVILGFGISTTQQVANISNWSIDGIVIGSAFIKTMFNRNSSDAIKALEKFCKDIRYTIDH